MKSLAVRVGESGPRVLAVRPGVWAGRRCSGVGVSLAATPQYEAHASCTCQRQGGAPLSNASYQESAASQQIALSLAKLISARSSPNAWFRACNFDMSASELAAKVEATVEPETVLIDLTVTDASPTDSARDRQCHRTRVHRLRR